MPRWGLRHLLGVKHELPLSGGHAWGAAQQEESGAQSFPVESRPQAASLGR